MPGSSASRRWVALAVLALGALGCRPPLPGPAVGARTPDAAEGYVNLAPTLGLDFPADVPRERPRDILEANGFGCAFLDYDGDGLLDVLLLGRPRCRLYRNTGTGFVDVTEAAGLARDGHWIGVGVGDWNNDGLPDLCISGYGTGAMYVNEGGRFKDVTAESGVHFPQWGQSVALADVNNDGLLDLYIAAFAEFGPGSQRHCVSGKHVALCGPELYPPEQGLLFLNRGRGRFEDITAASGLSGVHGRTWGAAFQDFNDDGYQDLYLGNDMIASDLLQNLGVRDGIPRFRNVGLESGTAYDGEGRRMGAMGVDWGDFDNDGRPDLVVTTFSSQPTVLFRNEGADGFTDRGFAAGVAEHTLPYVGFGAKFLDYDNDGWRDLFLVNGHIEDNVEQLRGGESYRQPTLLLRNIQGRFVSQPHLVDAVPPMAARGAAFGDFDNDGGIDALVMDLEGPPLLLRNECRRGNWLGLKLVGTRSNRDGIGARVLVRSGGSIQRLESHTSGSVLSANDPRLLVGLADAARAESVEIHWPSGSVSRWEGLEANRYHTLREPEAPGR
jgi:enediyne biosynthesis protein E4